MSSSEITRAHVNQIARIRSATSVAAAALVADITDPARDAAQFAALVTPVVLAGQTAVVYEVDGYLSLMAGSATGTSTEPLGLDPTELIGAKARRGTYLESVYARPIFDEARGGTRETATARVTQAVATDLALARRDATWVRMQVDQRLPRWRRITSGDSCALCTAAATRTYARINRMHIHPSCDCTTEPVAVDGPAPSVSSLRGTYRDLHQIRTVTPSPGADVHLHGELGPVLQWPGHQFT